MTQDTSSTIIRRTGHTLTTDESPDTNEQFQRLSTRRESDASTFTSYISSYSYIPGAVANLCSATLGAGILALPYALYQAGVICGGILLLSSAWATSASIRMLVDACDKFKISTYEQVVEHVLGRRARKIVEISILVFCLGTAVGYVIAVGDVMERVVYLSPARKRLAMSVVWLFAMLPLSCLRRMQSLQCASGVGIASIGTLLVAAIVHLIDPQDDSYIFQESSSSLKPFFGPAEGGWLAVLRACPIVFFAFSCQVNVCQIYTELPGHSGEEKVRTMKWVTWLAVGLCGLLYTSISLVSLMDFGADVLPNMLSCYTLTKQETLLHVAFLAMALAIVMAFPLNIFPARVSIIQMLGKRSCESIAADDQECQQLLQPSTSEDSAVSYNVMEEVEQGTDDPLISQLLTQESSTTNGNSESLYSGEEEEVEFQVGQHVLVTLLLAGSALGLALVIPNISVVFGLLGGTTSSVLGFVVPGLMGMKMNKADVSAWVLVVAGSLIGLLTTGVTLYSMVHDMKM
jgi:amino acid permease